MFVRVVFLLLLVLNIGAGCWLYYAPRATPGEPPSGDSGVPKLVLLSEADPEHAAQGGEGGAAGGDGKPSSGICASVGPFSTQADMRAAVSALTPLVSRIQFREVHITEVRGYWVYLPAPGNRERALSIARQLSSKGISDYYVVTAGEQSNAISLGLFRDAGNAEKRRSEILALGFKPEVTQRSDEVPVYWIDYAQSGRDPLDWRSRIGTHEDLHSQPIECF